MIHLAPSFTIALPMPTPGSPNAPLFKGQRVTDFLDSLEAHATAANIALNNLPAFVLRYCHRRVRNIINTSTIWTQHDWTAARSHLIKLYGSNDQKLKSSPNRLRKWVKLHTETCSITRLQDVDRYYRGFTARSTELIAGSLITNNKANLLFYKGIPSKLRKKVKRRIPQAHQTTLSPPSIASVFGYLRDEFDEDDIDDDSDDVELTFYSDEDVDDTDIDDDLNFHVKRKRTKSNVRHPTTDTTEHQVSSTLDVFANQLQEQIQALKNEQEAMLREFKSMIPTTPSTCPAYEKRCFICDLSDAHVLGLRRCPEVSILINEGLASFNRVGRLTRSDGSDLPRGLYGGGGVAKVLRDERVANQSPSSSKTSSFLYDDGEIIDDPYYVAYSSPALSSQPQDEQRDFAKGKHPGIRTKTAPITRQAASHSSSTPVAHSRVPQRMTPSSKKSTPHQFTRPLCFQDQSSAQPTTPFFSTQHASTMVFKVHKK